jgi:hypothetical protein
MPEAEVGMSALAGTVVLSLVSMAAASPSPAARAESPRLLLALTAAGQPTAVRLTVRNLSSRPVSFRGLTRLSLRLSGEGPRTGPPYWAPMDLRSARSPETSEPRPVRLAPGETQDVVVDLRHLSWAPGDCACWADGVFTRVVIPGRYELMAEIEEPDSGFWWRSNTAGAVMKRSRAFELSFE